MSLLLGKKFFEDCMKHHEPKDYKLVGFSAYDCHVRKMMKKANLSWKGTSTNYSDEIQDTIIVKHSRGESETCGKRIRKVMNSLVVVTESSNDALVKRREERRAKSFSGDRVSLVVVVDVISQAVKADVVTKAA